MRRSYELQISDLAKKQSELEHNLENSNKNYERLRKDLDFKRQNYDKNMTGK